MRMVLLPSSIDELWSVRKENPQAIIMAGGTDLLVKLRQFKHDAELIIGLERIEELQQIEMTESEIVIGAMVTHQQLLESPIITGYLPALAQAAEMLGSPAIRHMGTIGGNVCTASPAGDTLPPLYVLRAQLDLASSTVSRTAAIEELIQGPGKANLKDEEILKQIRIPLPDGDSFSSYIKVGQRKALAISICSMAFSIQRLAGQRIGRARVAWGSVGPTVMSFPDVDAILQGQPITAPLLKEYGKLAAQQVAPITDIRASTHYRRMLVANLPLRLLY